VNLRFIPPYSSNFNLFEQIFAMLGAPHDRSASCGMPSVPRTMPSPAANAPSFRNIGNEPSQQEVL
jgi:hypothetical protein